MPHYEGYGSWQSSNGGQNMYGDCGMLSQMSSGGQGYGGESGQQRQHGGERWGNSRGPSATGPSNATRDQRSNGPSSFDALRQSERLGAAGRDVREATAMMGELHLDQESTPGTGLSAHNDSSDDEDDKGPKEATQEEREEAEEVVRTAFREAKERDRLREKVGKASAADLQAMLNSRLGKR